MPSGLLVPLRGPTILCRHAHEIYVILNCATQIIAMAKVSPSFKLVSGG
jgi:hypothetical protein